MSIEVILLITESILLLVTLGLLLYSIREGRQRSQLLVNVEHATRTLTRLEYFLTVSESISGSKNEVIGCVTGRRPIGDDEKKVRTVIDTIRRATSKGVSVKYILPKLHERLYMGCLYKSAGAEVRYASCSLVNSMRYIVVDSSLVVIGIPKSAGKKTATSKGHKLPSKALASILKNHFDACWEGDLPLKAYINEVMSQTGMSIQRLSDELNIETSILTHYLEA